MKKVSVIIPHYNSKNSLLILLNSIPKEDWIEIIVIDDNSDFDIYELSNLYKNIHFYILSNDKKGAGAARNLGLEKATGSHLLFADSDDYFTKNAFDIIKSKLNTDNDIIFFKSTSLNYKTRKIANRHRIACYLVEDYIKHKNKEIFYKSYEPWGKLISINLVNMFKIKFDETIVSNDVMFSLKTCYYSSKIEAIDKIIYVITDSDSSLTKKKQESILDCRFEVATRYNDFLKFNNLNHCQTSMFQHIWNARRFGFYKFLYILFYCKYKKYPVLYSFKYFSKILFYEFKKLTNFNNI
jgi:glycosyltransferase involved in cell wall biosynthesis